MCAGSLRYCYMLTANAGTTARAPLFLLVWCARSMRAGFFHGKREPVEAQRTYHAPAFVNYFETGVRLLQEYGTPAEGISQKKLSSGYHR